MRKHHFWVHKKQCYLINLGSLRLPQPQPPTAKSGWSPNTVLGSCWLQSLRTQTIRAKGLIICSNLGREDELGEHQDKQHKWDVESPILLGLAGCHWGSLGVGGGGMEPPQMTMRNWNEWRVMKKVIFAVCALRKCTVPQAFPCVWLSRNQTGKRQRSPAAAPMGFFYSRSNTQKACLLDGLHLSYFTDTLQLWIVAYLADIMGIQSCPMTRGLSVCIGNSIRITKKHWGQGKHASDTYKAVHTPFWISADVRILW